MRKTISTKKMYSNTSKIKSLVPKICNQNIPKICDKL